MGKQRISRKKRQTQVQVVALILAVAMAAGLIYLFAGEALTRQQGGSVSGGLAQAEQYIQQGNQAYDSGDYNGAIRFYERALPARGKDPGLLTDLGTAYFYRTPSNPTKAIEYYDRALASDPTFPNALFNKGIVLSDALGKTAEALAVWEKLESQLPAGDPQAAKVKQYIAQAKAALKTPPPAQAPVQAPSTLPSPAPLTGTGSRLSGSFGR